MAAIIIPKASSSGMALPNRPKAVVAIAAGGSGASMTPAVRHGSEPTMAPRASMIALMPVGVERRTGRPSSAARNRARASCTGVLNYVRRIGSADEHQRQMSWAIDLVRSSDRWLIENVTAR